ncbi:MAG TPA: hypothetical protein VL974_06235 [Magnetospirillum sp.]|nr:hypothetical protein [Magnetospirillum sp.]
MRLRLLDLDGSVRDQNVFPSTAQVLDLGNEADSLRFWADTAAMRRFGQRIGAARAPEGNGPVVTFVGSGDFHHLTVALLAAVPEPVSLVHFDNHPDWVTFPPAYHCGSWVNRVIELPLVKRVVTIGPCADDLAWPQLKGGNLTALKNRTLEILPWRHGPSRLLGKPDIHWTALADRPDRAELLTDLFDRLPTEAVWISIDKDVLRPEEAVTNWDQGEMPLSALEEAVRLLAGRRRIIGVDVCGEYSPPAFASPLKRIAAWLDHPRSSSPVPADLQRNAATNQRLLGLLSEVL